MPNRSITDQVRLAKAMVNYAEQVEENGLIVALDQEKAYDKISQDYLWDTLRAYNLPENFIQTVKSLYDKAETVVILNGKTSEPFKVSRGVRQGCPLSCLLFNIAIEPLANMLRKSLKLKGYTIPGLQAKLITKLFADNTTVYLSKFDSYDDLLEILTLWCRASGAKYNINKTEIVPIGTLTYRNKVITNRSNNPNSNPFEDNIHIAKDTVPIRVLGAWIGNQVDDTAIWSPNVEKIREALERWGKSHPTMAGKRLILQMMAGGISQYMTATQGMPEQTQKTIQKIINNFIWEGGKARVNSKTMSAPLDKGGMKVLDLQARNNAIDLMKLRSYLKSSCLGIHQ